MVTSVALAFSIILSPFDHSGSSSRQAVPRVALLWTYSENESGTSKAGMEKADMLLRKLWEEKGACQIIPAAESQAAWQSVSGATWPSEVENPRDMRPLPTPGEMLKFGRAVKADFVSVGRLEWRVKSKWVGLGPKTRVTATTDVVIIDVRNQEVKLNVTGFESNFGKAEQWWESAGTLLVSWGFTLVSGGPKTPHVERAGLKAIGGATDPFFSTFNSLRPTKIDG